MERAALEPTEAAYYIHLREKELLTRARQGEIPCIRVGKLILFIRRDLDAWLEHQRLERLPATFRQIHTAPQGIPRVPGGTAEPSMSLVKGPKGRNRERLAAGERR